MHPFVYLIDATYCRNPHHRMALDALQFLSCTHARRWRRFLLNYYTDYLVGSKAPDTKFKDFRNHVLHVKQHNWGGAISTAQQWFELTVEAIQQGAWRNAAYSAGVLSHYITDPIHPFHTGQSKEETNIHRAFEWSTSKAYRRLRPLLEVSQDQCDQQLVDSEDWLRESLLRAANYANESYDTLIQNYDFQVGYRRPVAGLGSTCEKKLKELIRYSTHMLSLVLSRAFDEADVMPPHVHLLMESVFATAKAPVRMALAQIEDIETRYDVMRMHEEWERTGSVQTRLPEENRAIVDLIQQGGYEQARLEHERKLAIEEREAIRLAKKTELRTPKERRSTSVSHRLDSRPTPRLRASNHEPRARSQSKASMTGMPRSSNSIAESEHPPIQLETMNQSEAATTSNQTLPYSNNQPSHERSTRKINRGVEEASSRPTRGHDRPNETKQSRKGQKRYYLSRGSAVVDAPSIGPKTAKRLRKVDVQTVDDLLDAHPDQLSESMATGWITSKIVQEWQSQATLVCCIAGLRGHDAQLLVGCGYDTVEKVAFADSRKMLSRISEFVGTSDGQRIIRSSKRPDAVEIQSWISAAQNGRSLRDAA